MVVLDLFSGSDCYTELLQSLVGEKGKVIAHTNQAYIPYVGESYKTRYANNRLAQSEAVIAEVDDLELAPGSLDAALLVLT